MTAAYALTPLAASIVERAVSQLAPESETSAAYIRLVADALWCCGVVEGLRQAQIIKCVACKGRGEVWKREYGGEEWPEVCAECNGTGVAT